MVLKELRKLLNKIAKVHPEADDAQVYFKKKLVQFVGLDNKHKPIRVKLEE